MHSRRTVSLGPLRRHGGSSQGRERARSTSRAPAAPDGGPRRARGDDGTRRRSVRGRAPPAGSPVCGEGRERRSAGGSGSGRRAPSAGRTAASRPGAGRRRRRRARGRRGGGALARRAAPPGRPAATGSTGYPRRRRRAAGGSLLGPARRRHGGRPRDVRAHLRRIGARRRPRPGRIPRRAGRGEAEPCGCPPRPDARREAAGGALLRAASGRGARHAVAHRRRCDPRPREPRPVAARVSRRRGSTVPRLEGPRAEHRRDPGRRAIAAGGPREGAPDGRARGAGDERGGDVRPAPRRQLRRPCRRAARRVLRLHHRAPSSR
ncbi:hypothetical protein AMOR_53060 [Anaeromyxobacter oryzae]|uniref:LigA n=1 Tax=Anaeromyxobacter oryzae TaxID=2918170 RepID=A0ABM7X3D0_9BACT|nr:hypothetical protein AMOR_53060 [Anaeromyxobacter oryzae]